MQLQYKINEQDYLAHHLFSDSQSARLKKRRTIRRFIIPMIYVLLGLFLILGSSYFPGFAFLIVGLLYMLFYPKYSLWLHKRHYKKHIRENYSNRLDKEITFTLNAEEAVLKDDANEGRMKTTELEKLSETPDHYFLKTKSSTVIVLPKHSIQDQETLKKMIVFLKDDLKVPYYDELNWRFI